MATKRKPLRKPSNNKKGQKTMTEEKQEPKLQVVKDQEKEVEQPKEDIIPGFDKMPEQIDDPTQVFRMAYLETKIIAMNNKLALLIREFDTKLQALAKQKQDTIVGIKTQLEGMQREYTGQKQYIEEKHGIALSCYTYDDVSGILTKQDFLQKEQPPNTNN